jgi:uncharacterized membrane protein YedE/YeeE
MLWLVETFGESYSAGLVGLLVGLTFGIAAQRSQFCLRASVVEFARHQLGPRMAVWLLTLSTAIVWTQAADLAGIINSADARIMAIPGSYSGAIVGGAIFGVGMILTKGCSGRLLVLAASGNLRSAVKGLIFAVVAHSNRCRRLLLRPTIAVATRIKRKHQPASEAVFAARNRFICPFSSKTHCHRQTVERTASQDLARPCNTRRQRRSSHSVLRQSVEPAAETGHLQPNKTGDIMAGSSFPAKHSSQDHLSKIKARPVAPRQMKRATLTGSPQIPKLIQRSVLGVVFHNQIRFHHYWIRHIRQDRHADKLGPHLAVIDIQIFRCIALGRGNGFQNNTQLLGAITHFDHVAFFHPVRRDIDPLTVDSDMAVIDELTRSKNRYNEFGAVNNRIQTALQQTDQVLTGIAFYTFSFGIDPAELLFGQIAVIAFKLLLGAQLGAEIGQFALAALAVLTGAIFTTIYRGFRTTPDVFTHPAVNFVLGRRAFGHG